MSTFKTYSSEKKIFDFFLKHARKLNILFFLLYMIYFLDFSDRGRSMALIFIILVLIVVGLIYEIYLRRMKTNGTLELTKSKLSWTSEYNNLKIDKEEIEKIIIVKELLKSFFTNDFKFVLFDIVCKDKSLIHFIAQKYSTEEQEFDILNSLKVFAKINGITLEKKKHTFFSLSGSLPKINSPI